MRGTVAKKLRKLMAGTPKMVHTSTTKMKHIHTGNVNHYRNAKRLYRSLPNGRGIVKAAFIACDYATFMEDRGRYKLS